MNEEHILYRLDDEGKEIAERELNEIPGQTENAIRTFRTWILQQKWLTTPTDDHFLLLFLRSKKFSQLGARNLLENYWKVRKDYPEWFKDLDPADPNIQFMIERGGFLILPKKDKLGRRIILRRAGMFDESCYQNRLKVRAFVRLGWLLLHYLYMDENAVVKGAVYFADYTHLSTKEEKAIGDENVGRFVTHVGYTNKFPGRNKAWHIYNHGAVFQAVWNVVKFLLKEKARNKVYMHGKSLVNLYRHLDMSAMPSEYLPDDYDGPTIGSIDDVIEYTKKELANPKVAAFLKYLNNDEYGVTESLKPVDVPPESFRKLDM